ncbi:hypothetical protein DQ04_01331080, partial [Trypanosoma grayi]|uniref:hypothetical protein n=1 Tax=Trypanosoma grayi TaxID=71804 RepID=UPI0004F41321
MASIVNTTVLQYLEEHYPTVAEVFRNEEPKIKWRRLAKGTTLESLIIDSQRGEKHPADPALTNNEQHVAKRNRTEGNPPVPDSSSDDDDEPVRKPVAKGKASPA